MRARAWLRMIERQGDHFIGPGLMATVYLHHNRPRQDRLGNPSLRSGLGSHSLRSLSVVCCIVPARNESFPPLADPAKNKQRSYLKEAIRGTRTMDGIMDETHPFIGYVSVGPLSLFPLGCTLLFDLSAYVAASAKHLWFARRPVARGPFSRKPIATSVI
jgi:hypothetical protein